MFQRFAAIAATIGALLFGGFQPGNGAQAASAPFQQNGSSASSQVGTFGIAPSPGTGGVSGCGNPSCPGGANCANGCCKNGVCSGNCGSGSFSGSMNGQLDGQPFGGSASGTFAGAAYSSGQSGSCGCNNPNCNGGAACRNGSCGCAQCAARFANGAAENSPQLN